MNFSQLWRALGLQRGEEPDEVLLDVSHLRQGDNLCVPTCAAMALAYYGETRTPEALKALAVSSDAGFAGTYFRDLIKGMATIGYHWLEKCYRVDESGFRKGLRDIHASLAKQCPVLVDLNIPSIGHTVLLIGYNRSAQQLTYLDPNEEAPGLTTISYQEFQNVWYSLSSPIRGAIYTQPKRR